MNNYCLGNCVSDRPANAFALVHAHPRFLAHTHAHTLAHTHMLACTHTHMLAHTAGFPIVPVRIGLPGAAAASPSLAPLPPSSSKPSAVGAARAPVRVRAVAFFLRGFRAGGLVRFATSSSSNLASTFCHVLVPRTSTREGKWGGEGRVEWVLAAHTSS